MAPNGIMPIWMNVLFKPAVLTRSCTAPLPTGKWYGGLAVVDFVTDYVYFVMSILFSYTTLQLLNCLKRSNWTLLMFRTSRTHPPYGIDMKPYKCCDWMDLSIELSNRANLPWIFCRVAAFRSRAVVFRVDSSYKLTASMLFFLKEYIRKYKEQWKCMSHFVEHSFV